MPESRTAQRQVKRPPFSAPHVFVLAVIDGHDASAVYRLDCPECFVGRGEDAHVAIDNDEEVSKRHCMIRVDGSTCTLIDLGSLNGTLLNCRPLRPDLAQRLRHMDEIQVGDTRLLFLSGRFKRRPEHD